MKNTRHLIPLLAILVFTPGCRGGHEQTPGSTMMSDVAVQSGDRVVFFGDSITEAGVQPGGYVSLLQERAAEKFPDGSVELFGAGISGNKVSDLLERVDRDVYSLDPSVVVIYIGTNDVWHWHSPPGARGTTEDDFAAGLEELIRGFHDRDTRVLLCTPAVIGEQPRGQNELDEMLDRYADIQRDVAASTAVTLCDLRERFVTHLAEHNSEAADHGILTTDGVHLNESWNRFVARQMGEFLGLN
jgi:lysophospholipase L1-like esterase